MHVHVHVHVLTLILYGIDTVYLECKNHLYTGIRLLSHMIVQESPFAMKDVNSRGAKIASMNRVRGKVARKGRNPNAVQPKGRRK